jgi:hypothetical protein
MSPSENDEPATPEQIERQIEQTRAELADTVEALAYKADVKARTKEKAVEVTQRAKTAAAESTQRAKAAAAGSTQTAKEKATTLAQGAAGKASLVAEKAKQVAPGGKSQTSPETPVTSDGLYEFSSTPGATAAGQEVGQPTTSSSPVDRRSAAIAAGGLAGLLLLVGVLLRRRSAKKSRTQRWMKR